MREEPVYLKINMLNSDAVAQIKRLKSEKILVDVEGMMPITRPTEGIKLLCTTCNGTGTVPRNDGSGAGTVEDICPTCYGRRGVVSDYICQLLKVAEMKQMLAVNGMYVVESLHQFDLEEHVTTVYALREIGEVRALKLEATSSHDAYCLAIDYMEWKLKRPKLEELK